jgi:hypothetical protein
MRSFVLPPCLPAQAVVAGTAVAPGKARRVRHQSRDRPRAAPWAALSRPPCAVLIPSGCLWQPVSCRALSSRRGSGNWRGMLTAPVKWALVGVAGVASVAVGGAVLAASLGAAVLLVLGVRGAALWNRLQQRQRGGWGRGGGGITHRERREDDVPAVAGGGVGLLGLLASLFTASSQNARMQGFVADRVKASSVVREHFEGQEVHVGAAVEVTEVSGACTVAPPPTHPTPAPA